MRALALNGLVLFVVPSLLGQAAADTTTRVSFGAYVDAYYAYDFGRPRGIDRAFTTQPARHNEFNANLAYLEAKLTGPRVRGRLALQAGTSVQANYAGEPAIGSVSGPGLARHIQEAFAGVRVASGIWLDAGIFYSHVGSESWATRDNPTYTRSLNADFSPYYQAGAKLTWKPSSRLTAQLNVVNGWQIIAENNGAKTAGIRVDYLVSPKASLSLYNLLGNEQPDSLEARIRTFQGASLRVVPNSRTTIVATFDFGWQEGSAGSSGSSWYGATLIGQIHVTPQLAFSGRIERYDDKHQVIIVTGSPHGFRVNGGSFGLDLAPASNLLWRTELRGLSSKDPIYPDRSAATGLSRGDGLVVTSLSVWF